MKDREGGGTKVQVRYRKGYIYSGYGWEKEKEKRGEWDKTKLKKWREEKNKLLNVYYDKNGARKILDFASTIISSSTLSKGREEII